MRFFLVALLGVTLLLLPAPSEGFKSTIQNATGLAIGDASDNMIIVLGTPLLFHAFYYDAITGAPILNASCTIIESITGSTNTLSYNSNTTRYEFTKTFLTSGDHTFTVTCSAPNHQPITLSEAFAVAQPVCQVDVKGMAVQASTIVGAVNNTGTLATNITLTISVNGSRIFNQTHTLNASQAATISVPYTFKHGEYQILTHAVAMCGDTDNETFIHTVFENYKCTNPPGFLNENFCNYATRNYYICTEENWKTVDDVTTSYCKDCPNTCGDGVCNCLETYNNCRQDCTCQQKYLDFSCDGNILRAELQYQNCTSTMIDIVECDYGCEDDACLPAPSLPGGVTPGCDIEISGFDFSKTYAIGEQQTARVTVKNTGEIDTSITVKLSLDNTAISQNKVSVPTSQSKTLLLYYTPTTSGHTLLLKATSTCGITDTVTAIVSGVPASPTVFGNLTPYTFPVVTPPPEETAVTLLPESLDIPVQQSGFLSLDITSHVPQDFSIQITGVPDHWLQYPKQIYVTRADTVYVYVLPDATGTKDLSIAVRALTEGRTFSLTVPVFVSIGTGPQGGTLWDNLEMWVAETVSLLQQNPALLVALVVILIIVALLLGHRKLREDELFES